MPDERQLESVSEASAATAIDRELGQLLSMAPSPEFAARVRRQIHDDAAARHSRAAWWIGLAAAAAAAVVVMLASRAWRADDPPHQVRAAADVALPRVAAQTPVRETPAPGPQQIARRVHTHLAPSAPRVRDGGPSQPDVLVSRDQRRAIARLRELILAGELTDRNMPAGGSAPGVVPDIGLPPLTIAPLVVPDVDVVAARGRPER